MTERTLDEWKARLAVCEFGIKTIEQYPNEPGYLDALAHYQRQRAEINAIIATLTGGPEPVIVHMQTAQVTGKAIRP